MLKLAGKVAIVTGASKGIGKGIALRYAREGASVVLASHSLDLLSGVADQIARGAGKALPLEVDVTNPQSVEALVKKSVEYFGHLDVMVNNAGISVVGPSAELSPREFNRALETDLCGVFYGCQSAGRVMISHGGGSIINITSMYGRVAAPGRVAYCVSKAGANMLTRVLAAEWAKYKIRVNAVAPGYVRTELVQSVIDKGLLPLEGVLKRTPLGRIGEVEDIMGLAVYLAADESAFMTGSILHIDGGWEAYGYI